MESNYHRYGIEHDDRRTCKAYSAYVGNEPFMLTYGDGVSDINITELLKFHQSHGKIATLTAVHVGQRFGVLDIDREDKSIRAFREKSESDGSRINAGYMVLQPEIFDYIDDDETVFEQEPLRRLAETRELKAYKHNGFWQCMDTQREKRTVRRNDCKRRGTLDGVEQINVRVLSWKKVLVTGHTDLKDHGYVVSL